MEPSDRTRMWGFNASNYNVATMRKLIVKVKKEKNKGCEAQFISQFKERQIDQVKGMRIKHSKEKYNGP